MTNKKLIKYAVAFGRIREVAALQNWGAGSPISYQSELQDDYAHYAEARSGLKNHGCINILVGCSISAVSGLVGAVLGASLFGNSDRLISTIAYKTLAGIGGFISGFLVGSIYNIPEIYREEVVNSCINERNKRKQKRKWKIRDSQIKAAGFGLMLSESDRFDMMTGGKFSDSKPPQKVFRKLSDDLTDRGNFKSSWKEK